MDCENCREALSAHLDGEFDALTLDAMRAHVGSCASCRAHEAALADLHRAVRVREAEAVPDLSAAIMANVTLPQRRALVQGVDWARYALFVVAATQLALAAPGLVLGQDAGASVHVARELGALNVALAAGLLLAAWQPRRTAGLLPVAAALAAAMLIRAFADVTAGRMPVLSEAHHLLELFGLLFLWLVARRSSSSTHESRARGGFGLAHPA